jgi:hypothetical protein
MAPKKTSENEISKNKETITQKVRRHLTDKNDIITDEDLKETPVGEITADQEQESEEFADDLSKNKNKKTTPWDILDEE